MTRIILIRHAETSDAVAGRCYGSLDVGLSEHGCATARHVADVIASTDADFVCSSPQRRALETAAPIAAALGVGVSRHASLRELDFGDFEGRSYAEIAATSPELYRQWMETPAAVRFPHGEGFTDLSARVLPELAALREQRVGRTSIIVSHSGVCRAVVADALALAADDVFRLDFGYGRVSVLDWFSDGPLLRALNSSDVPPHAFGERSTDGGCAADPIGATLERSGNRARQR